MKKLALLAVTCLVLAPFAPALAATQQINYGGSHVKVDKTSVNADGIDNATVTVSLEDFAFQGVSGQTVTLTSSRGSKDEIKPASQVSDSYGHATFLVDSLVNGNATFTASVGGVNLNQTVTITFGNGLTFPIADGALIKIPDDNNPNTLSDTAVYYYASNGRRYVFPNEKVFFTWYPDFSNVQVIPIDQMSLIPIGGNVTYKPGSKLVKFQTDTKTYLPTKGGVLRWVQTEDVAKGLFGTNWNQHVDDISEAFYVNYTFGDPIASALDAPLDIVSQKSPTIDADKGL